MLLASRVLLASHVLLVSRVMPPGCGSASGSDGAARLGRAAGGAALLWDHRAVFNATKECHRSQGPSLGAGSGWALVLLQLLSLTVSGRGKGCVLCLQRHRSPSTQIFHFLGAWHCQSRAGFASVGSPIGAGAEPWEKAALHPQRQS